MCRYAIRHWLELIRKRTGKSVKHWVITEKGEDYNRIHMHGIVWCRKEDVDAWRYGYTYIGDYVNGKTINYITKYMLKINEKCPEFEGKVFCRYWPRLRKKHKCKTKQISGRTYYRDLQGRGRPRTANAKVLPRQDILRRRARKVMDHEARERLQIHRR